MASPLTSPPHSSAAKRLGHGARAGRKDADVRERVVQRARLYGGARAPCLLFLPPPPRQWFNGNQTALWTSTGSTGNAFLINVHGTDNVVVGDVTIAAYTPIEEEWFCDGFSVFTGAQ